MWFSCKAPKYQRTNAPNHKSTKAPTHLDRGTEEEHVELPGVAPQFLHLVEEGRCKATWKSEFKLPWRKAGPLKTFRWLSGFGPVGCQQRTLSLLHLGVGIQGSGFRAQEKCLHLRPLTSELATFYKA